MRMTKFQSIAISLVIVASGTLIANGAVCCKTDDNWCVSCTNPFRSHLADCFDLIFSVNGSPNATTQGQLRETAPVVAILGE